MQHSKKVKVLNSDRYIHNVKGINQQDGTIPFPDFGQYCYNTAYEQAIKSVEKGITYQSDINTNASKKNTKQTWMGTFTS